MKQELKKKLESIKSKEIISHTHTLIHSKRNHSFRKTLSISIVTSILLSNQLVLAKDITLPSGGKFTNGSSGSINIGKGQGSCTTSNCMSISGNHKNNVIAWGGGFNIGKGYEVHFEKGKNGGNNYLNLDYSKNPSTIAGLLQGNNNNVFIVNPSGVIVTESGSINANKFGISTSAIDADTLNAFKEANKNNTLASFSPVFKSNSTRGDIINKGSINAGNVKLVGNRVILQAGVNLQEDGKIGVNKINTNNINIEGNTINIDVATLENNPTLNLKANKDGNLYLSATGYYYNTNAWNNTYSSFTNIKDTHNQYISIGSDVDWWHFAKGWNEYDLNNEEVGKAFRETASEYRLTNNIDFGANCDSKGNCTGQNYADYWIDFNDDGIKQDDERTSMMIGYYLYKGVSGGPSLLIDKSFNKAFNGQGYTLKNINIDTSKIENARNVGIFATVGNGAKFSNINIDYGNGGIKALEEYSIGVGGFVGMATLGSGEIEFSNITLKNISSIETVKNPKYANGGYSGQLYIGGFLGSSSKTTIDSINVSNVAIDKIGTIKRGGDIDVYLGGFTPSAKGKFNNISITNIGSIISSTPDDFYEVGRGSGFGNISGEGSNIIIKNINFIDGSGFGSASGEFSNIKISNIGKLVGSHYGFVEIGGFGGSASGKFDNISISNIGSIIGGSGFATLINGGKFSNISISDIGSISGDNSGRGLYVGGFAGKIDGGTFENISISNIGDIIINSSLGVYANAGGFAGKINGGTFKNISINNIGDIKAFGGTDIDEVSAGGFVGTIYGKNPVFENIVLNGIGSIEAVDMEKETDSECSICTGSGIIDATAGGFAGFVFTSKDTPAKFSNIYIKFKEGATIKTSGKDNSNDIDPWESAVGQFIGVAGDYTEESTTHSDTGIQQDNINLYYSSNSEIKDLEEIGKKYTKFEIIGNPITTSNNLDNFNQDVKDGITSIKEDAKGNLIFTNDFSVTEPTIIPPTSNQDTYLNTKDTYTKIDLEGNNFSKEILDLILKDFYNEKIIIDLQKSFDENGNFLYANLPESLKQSITFLLAFSDENLGALETILKNSNINNINGFDTIKPEINHIKAIQSKFQEDIKALGVKVAFLKKMENLINSYNNATNESHKLALQKEIEKGLATMNKYQEELKGYVAKGEYYLKDNAGIQQIGYVKLTNPFNLYYEENKENTIDQTITSPLKDINASMLDKQQVVLIKPAEEEKETLDEEKGVLNQRTCVVSENFKTNNPCMAQRI